MENTGKLGLQTKQKISNFIDSFMILQLIVMVSYLVVTIYKYEPAMSIDFKLDAIVRLLAALSGVVVSGGFLFWFKKR